MFIETKNLKLIQCNEDILQAAISRDSELSIILGCNVSENWSEFGLDIFSYVLNRIKETPEEQAWWTYFPIHKKDNQLIGSGGYKGSPSKKGVVEIGYEITSTYRNRGLATEMTKGLITHAFVQGQVKLIQAHTLAHFNASTRLLVKCGFAKKEELDDPEDGLIWKWVLNKRDINV